MGEQRVSQVNDQEQMQTFVKRLLDDLKAIEFMLERKMFETDTIRIGAEQEMCLINKKTYKPAPVAMEVLKKTKEYPWLETELAKFNLETNMTPREFTGNALSQMEVENSTNLDLIRHKMKRSRSTILLCGILPTLRKFDLELHNLTPKKRYRALIDSIHAHLQGSSFELRLAGIDELNIKHDSPLLEAANTSFQVHLQVKPDEFAPMYNIAQALAGPCIAIAANSPIVFGRRLWHESRIALFQQALDTRTSHDHMRQRSPRVSFGDAWLDNSILEIYREDIARFRVLLAADLEENSLEELMHGRIPKLRALQVHNSTVYRWNRPCYGISDNGMPHLRIENRVLPAGPTVIDEMANAAFWLGAMVGMRERYGDAKDHFSYADIRDNFIKAARSGIDSKFTWCNDKKMNATDLVIEELLPLARQGLRSQKIDEQDIDRYLGVIEGRMKTHTNGARWQLRAYTQLKDRVQDDEAVTILTACMLQNQLKGDPVHTWELPRVEDLKEYRPFNLRVQEFMETDLFTVQKDDLLDLVSEMMDWKKVRYLPVEDKNGCLVGLVTTRKMLRHFTRKNPLLPGGANMVKEIMISNPITIGPQASIVEALRIMRTKKIGCLPVTKDDELIGIITEMDFLRISGRLIERIGAIDPKEKSDKSGQNGLSAPASGQNRSE